MLSSSIPHIRNKRHDGDALWGSYSGLAAFCQMTRIVVSAQPNERESTAGSHLAHPFSSVENKYIHHVPFLPTLREKWLALHQNPAHVSNS